MFKVTKTAVVAGVSVLALVGVGGGVAFAADSSPSTPVTPTANSSATPSGSASSTPGKTGDKAKKKARGPLARAEHAEATLRTKTGTEVVDLQRGTVTAVSPTSITVKSKDGFTATYVVGTTTKVTKTKKKAAIANVAGNDQVTVVALKSGTTDTARRIADPGPAKPATPKH